MPDEKGITRRQRNEDFNQASAPDMYIPEGGEYLWDWFTEIKEMVRRVSEGVCAPIPPTEYKAWAEIFGHLVRPSEYAILRAMDAAFCEEMNVEMAEYRVRASEEGKKPNG